ncbi:MAG TPA: acetoin utilization protein AcuB [Eubacteriaceae bacterium]|nr:acetoin utilization protein AcuB [Eubacteriaceae bacterium]
MHVKNIMSKDLKTLRSTDTIADAVELMRAHKIRHIPIVDDDYSVAGIVSDRDIRDVSPSIFNEGREILPKNTDLSQIMKTTVITGSTSDYLEEVAGIFYEYKISCLPITDSADRLVGIVTESDLLKFLMELVGGKPSLQRKATYRIEVELHNRSGSLCEVIRIISEHHINIISMFMYTTDEKMEEQNGVFFIESMNPNELIRVLKSKGYQVLWPSPETM